MTNLSPYRYILGQRVDFTTYERAVKKVLAMALDGSGGYVIFSTVNTVMEAHDDPDLQRIVNSAALVTPDGMPLVWGLKLLGIKDAERVYGPTFTLIACRKAGKLGIPVGFYGSTETVLNLMVSNLKAKVPGLHIAYAYSPPFRTLTMTEDKKVVKEIVDSGAKILFVGLGAPKQYRWMAENKKVLSSIVMLGVGAAFDFIAGVKPQAPGWMQRTGLEWLFRLITEPRRLWRRYLYHNPRFMFLFGLQVLGLKKTL